MQFKEQLVNGDAKPKASRLSFGEELAVLGEKHGEIVALDADLSKSTRTDIFAKKFPARFFNVGIAEANMIGMAAGLANAGMIPFAASFGCFLTGRFDQIRMSVSFSGARVRLIGTHSGVGIGEDGHSQMALEDLGLMRSLPNMTVFQPADDWDTREFMRWSMGHAGPCYMRLTRQNLLPLKRTDETFAVGKWDRLTAFPREKGVFLLASGGLVGPTLNAADLLPESVRSRVAIVNANWIQPIDVATLQEITRLRPSLVVTLEDHYVTAGLGGAVCEALCDIGATAPVLRIGVREFGQSGTPEANYQHYGFTPEAIAKRITAALG